MHESRGQRNRKTIFSWAGMSAGVSYMYSFFCSYLTFLKTQIKQLIHWTHAMCIWINFLSGICYNLSWSTDKTTYSEHNLELQFS